MAAARNAGCTLEGAGPDRGFVLAGVRFVPHTRAVQREAGA